MHLLSIRAVDDGVAVQLHPVAEVPYAGGSNERVRAVKGRSWQRCWRLSQDGDVYG